MSTERNAVGWFEIYVTDMGRAKRFYAATFGVEFQRLDHSELEMWAFPMKPEAPGATGALVHMPGLTPGGGGTMVYFSCADCAVEARKAAENGGRVDKDKFSIDPYGFIAFVFDTEGNRIGLHSLH